MYVTMQIYLQIYAPRELQEVSVALQLCLIYLPWPNDRDDA